MLRREGSSITLVTREDWRHAKELIRILKEASQPVPDELIQMSQRYASFQERKSKEQKFFSKPGGRGGGLGKRDGSFHRTSKWTK